MSTTPSPMTLPEAQADMRRAYVGGGPGVVVSALVWFAAAAMESRLGLLPAFATLFFGGMLIFPLGLLAERLLFRRAAPAPGNPLGRVALESTIAMIGGLFAAWLFLRFEPAFVFPLAAVAVGTHYAAFRTVYGDVLYWILGALITAVGVVAVLGAVPLAGGPILWVAMIEAAFGVLLTVRATRGGSGDSE